MEKYDILCSNRKTRCVEQKVLKTSVIEAVAEMVNVSEESYDSIGSTFRALVMQMTNFQSENNIFTENAMNSTIQILHAEVLSDENENGHEIPKDYFIFDTRRRGVLEQNNSS